MQFDVVFQFFPVLIWFFCNKVHQVVVFLFQKEFFFFRLFHFVEIEYIDEMQFLPLFAF